MTPEVQPVDPRPQGQASGEETKTGSAGTGSALPARFGKNVFMNYAAQGLAALSAIVLTPILLHHLGKTTYGLWVVASSFVVYLELFELGFGAATIKLISEDASLRPSLALRSLNTTFFVLVPLGLIALVVGVGLAFALPHISHVGGDLKTTAVLVVAVLALGLAVSIPGDSFGGALMGHQRYDLLATSNGAMTLITAAVSILVVVSGGGIVLLAITTTAISIFFHLVRFSMVRRILPGTRISPHLVDPQRRRHALHLSRWFLLQAFLTAAYNTGDVLIVGIVLGLRDAAIYAVGSKLATAAINGLDSMAQIFFPYASSAARNQEPGALAEISLDAARVSMAAGLMISVVLIVLAAPGIHAWVGPGYHTSVQVLIILAAGTALASPVRAITNIMLGSGQLRMTCAIRSVEVTVNIGLSIALGLAIGPAGVAIGTLAGILLVRLPGFLVAGCRATGLKISTLLRRSIAPNIPPAIAATVVLLLLRLAPLGNLPWVIFEAAAGAATYLLVFFTTSASVGERQRALAFVTRPLPGRWRVTIDGASPMVVADKAP